MAKTATERQQEKRKRDLLKEEDRLYALLAFTLSTQVFKGTAECLDRIMAAAGLDERDDAITRMIHAVSRMTDEQIADLLRSP